MNTLNLEIYSNNNHIKIFKNIEYERKQEFIYFKINDTKYFFYENIPTLSYLTNEEKVKMNFKENIVSIALLNTNYKLDIKINKFMYEIKENTYKITYVLDSEADVTKTIFITLS